jgi:hypothetical protein
MEMERSVRLARAFCSARDRNVPVLRKEARSSSPSAAAPSAGSSARPSPADDLPELVSCLDYGVRCTGWLCPLFTLPTLPPEDLLAEAVQAERKRKKQTVRDGRAILERAVKEGLVHKDRDAR